jgi:hypothetical protein
MHKEAKIKTHNQVHRPLKKRFKLDAEQEKVTMFYKIGKCTMPFCRMTKLACVCLESNINRYMEKHNQKLEGIFFYAR